MPLPRFFLSETRPVRSRTRDNRSGFVSLRHIINISLFLIGIALFAPANAAICVGTAQECHGPGHTPNKSKSPTPKNKSAPVPITPTPAPSVTQTPAPSEDIRSNDGAAPRNNITILHPDTDTSDRIALVIGNANYSSVAPLDTPLNDVKRIAPLLRSLGFIVYLVQDSTRAELNTTIKSFISAAAGKKIGLVYYAGHAVQFEGRNYFVPVDATISGGSSVKDIVSTFQNLDEIIDLVSNAVTTRIFLIDACRNEVSHSTFSTAGLALVETKFYDVFIGFSTAPNAVSLDLVAEVQTAVRLPML